RRGSALSCALALSQVGQQRARGHLQRNQPSVRPRHPGRKGGGTMELKKDINAVSIDMLLIVHSEKRRAAQGTHSDQQADPSALLQRRGGNVRPTHVPVSPGTSVSSPQGPARPRVPRHLGLLAKGARPPGGAHCSPERVPWQRTAP
ncbi:hypothetical protein P7K49_031606, partial [Saguinus oedipus]